MDFGDLLSIKNKEKLNEDLQHKIKDLEYIIVELEKERKNEKILLKEENRNLEDEIEIKDNRIAEFNSDIKILEKNINNNIDNVEEMNMILYKKDKEIKKMEDNLKIYFNNLENKKIKKNKDIVEEMETQNKMIRKLSTDIELKNRLNSECFQKILEMKKTRKPVIRKQILNQIKNLVKKIKVKRRESISKIKKLEKFEKMNSGKSINTISMIKSINKNPLKIKDTENDSEIKIESESELEIHNLFDKRYSRISLSKFNREKKKNILIKNNLTATRISINDFNNNHEEYNLRKKSSEITNLDVDDNGEKRLKKRSRSLFLDPVNKQSLFYERFDSFGNKSDKKIKKCEIIKLDYKDQIIGNENYIKKECCLCVKEVCTDMLFQFHDYYDYNY